MLRFCANNSGFDKYLFQLITLLKPDISCCNNFALSCVFKVTSGALVILHQLLQMLHFDLQR